LGFQATASKVNSLALGTDARSDIAGATGIGTGAIALQRAGSAATSSITLGTSGNGTTDYFLPGLAITSPHLELNIS
jgi:hypothetical protein